MYVKNKIHAFAIMKYSNMRGTDSHLEEALSTAIVGKHDNGWHKIDDDLFWDEVLLENINCVIYLENHRIRDLKELVDRYIQWDVDIKWKEKNWCKEGKHKWKSNYN